MLQTASTLSIDLVSGSLDQSDPISAKANLAITLTSPGSLTASNIKAALYRLNRNGVDGTLVATCNSFNLSSGALVGSMSLNTQELVTAFTNFEALRQYEKATFTILVYDASQNVYLVFTNIDLSWENSLASGTPPSVSPITSGTTSWGNFKLLAGGVIGIQSTDDGEYYQLTVGGVGQTVHGVIGESGVL